MGGNNSKIYEVEAIINSSNILVSTKDSKNRDESSNIKGNILFIQKNFYIMVKIEIKGLNPRLYYGFYIQKKDKKNNKLKDFTSNYYINNINSKLIQPNIIGDIIIYINIHDFEIKDIIGHDLIIYSNINERQENNIDDYNKIASSTIQVKQS